MHKRYSIILGFREWITTDESQAIMFITFFGMEGFKIRESFCDEVISGIENVSNY